MKRFFTKFTVVALMLASTLSLNSCTEGYDDSELKDAVEGLQSDVDDLEEQLATLQDLVEASQEELKISSIKNTEFGYTMTFSDGSIVEVKNSLFQKVIKDYESDTLTIILNDGTPIKFDMTYTLRTLTFEDEDYVGSGNYLGESNWSSLIDSKQYGGEMLYGAGGWGNTDYNWYDEGNTELYSECITSYDLKNFMSGGHAISNYIKTEYDGTNYTEQLSVSVSSGHNGSENFCVHNGYTDDSSFASEYPTISFKDGEARIIDHMYVVATSYLINYVTNGTDSGSSFAEGHHLKIVATGYNKENKTETVEFEIAKYDGSVSYTNDWTKWDLSSLGAVTRIEINMKGNDSNQYGLNTPAYFAFDDVAVRFYEAK